MNLEDLQIEIESDLRMGDDMALESLRLPTLLNKYSILRNKEKLLLNDTKARREQVYSDVWMLWADIREPREGESRSKLSYNKTEAMEAARWYKTVKELDQKLSIRKVKVEYLEQMISHIAFRNNTIKNVIDWKRLMMGG